MRDRIKTILKNKSGVTFVFALVVFMIAAIISATIVSVAMNNLKRVQSKRSSEQARIAVLDAAQYLGSGNPKLNARMNALTDYDVGKRWTVSASGGEVGDALNVSIKWTEVEPGSLLKAEIASGDSSYSASVRLVYESTSSSWIVKRIIKTGS